MGTWVIRLSGVAAALFVVGPLLAMTGAVAPLRGFVGFGLGGLLGVIALVLGVISIVRGSGGGLGLLVGAAITAIFLLIALPGRGLPRINDITTDPTAPPQFVHAPTLPGNQGRDMKYPGAEFAAQQKAGYPDLKGLQLSSSPDDAFRKVEAAAKALPGTEVTHVDASRRALEGVSTSRLFRFQDDFVIEVRPLNDGSIVQMRSKSRDGKGDIGANAARIRALLALLR